MGLCAPPDLLPPFLVCCYTQCSCWKDRSHGEPLGLQLLARINEFFIEPVRLLLEAAWIPHWSGETAPQTVLPARFSSVNSVYCETVAGEWILRGVIKSLTSEATRNILLCKTVCFRVCNLLAIRCLQAVMGKFGNGRKSLLQRLTNIPCFVQDANHLAKGKKLMWKFLNYYF